MPPSDLCYYRQATGYPEPAGDEEAEFPQPGFFLPSLSWSGPEILEDPDEGFPRTRNSTETFGLEP
jgi:hypothetical protein